MRNKIFNSGKTLALILAWALWVVPTLAIGDESAQFKEGSKSKEYSHGSSDRSPHGGGTPHGAKEGSKSKKYSHGSSDSSPHGGKSYGSHSGKSYGGHGSGSHSKKYSGGSHSKKYSGGHSRYSYGKSGHGHKTDPFNHLLRFGHRLGLTEAQMAEIKNKQFEFRIMEIQLHAEHRIAHLEMDRLVHSGNLDEAGLRALADKMSDLKSKSIHAMVEAKIALLRILSAEQRQKMSRFHSGH